MANFLNMCMLDLNSTVLVLQEWFLLPISFAPVVDAKYSDDPVFPKAPIDLLLTGDFNRVPWITGVTTDEGYCMSWRELHLASWDPHFELTCVISKPPKRRQACSIKPGFCFVQFSSGLYERKRCRRTGLEMGKLLPNVHRHNRLCARWEKAGSLRKNQRILHRRGTYIIQKCWTPHKGTFDYVLRFRSLLLLILLGAFLALAL